MPPPAPALVVRVDDVSCAIASTHVIETMRSQPLSAMDGMPSFTLGVATIRGSVTPVIDLGALLGAPAAPRRRLVTLRGGNGIVALAVDEVVGLVSFAEDELAARPAIASATPETIVSAIAMRDAALHFILNTSKVVERAAARS